MAEQPRVGVEHYPFIGNVAPPMVVATEGNYLVMADGRRILDGAGGAIVANIGHGRAEVAEVAARSVAEVDYVIPPWATPQRVALRDRLVSNWLPSELSRVGFCSGGSEAADTAIRLAHAHHVARGQASKWRVIGRRPSYHGVTIASLSAGGHLGRRAGYENILLDFPLVAWDDADALEAAIDQVGADTVAAFIAEPIIGAAGGVLLPPEGYFARVAEICRRHDILLIVDEVMSGFGRAGTPFGIEHYGVVPDIMYGGKGLGGGYAAIAGVFARSSVTDPITAAGHNFMFFTFGAQSTHCAVADKVLQIMEDEQLVERSAKMGEVLLDRLETTFGDHPHVAAVRGQGLWAGIELVADRSPYRRWPAASDMAQRVSAAALERGAWIYPSGAIDPVQDAVMFGPAFTISESEIDHLVEVTLQAVDAAAASA